MSDADAGELKRRLVGRSASPASNLEVQRRRLGRQEDDARSVTVAEALHAAAWCRARELPLAEGALLAWALDVRPGDERVTQQLAAAVPDHFPFKGDGVAGHWANWTRKLLASGAHFVKPDDPAWIAVRGTLWHKQALHLRSENLILHTTAHDPEVVSTVLQRGEQTVQALHQHLAGARNRRRADSDEDRLEIRLHATREAYLAEEISGGFTAMPWSAGFYSPAERVSRFYQPAAGETHDPLGRGLFAVVAHELCHHYVDRHWPRVDRNHAGPVVEQPGFWIVEGFARFIEDQVLEIERRGDGLDDDTVRSLDATSQAVQQEHLIDPVTLIDGNYAEFQALGDEPLVTVQLRNTLGALVLSERALFYEESGALTWFLMHRRGPSGRSRLIEYLRQVYAGKSPEKGWRALGFESAGALRSEFLDFLQARSE